MSKKSLGRGSGAGPAFFEVRLGIRVHPPFAVHVFKYFRRHVLLVVDRQQPHEVLPPCLPHPEALVSDIFLQSGHLAAGVLLLLAVQLEGQGELPRGGGPGLDAVQVGGVLPQQLPEGGVRLLLHPPAVPVLVALEGFTGIQRQQPDGLHAPQEVGQGYDLPPDAL